MKRAIAIVEFTTVSAGILAADLMAKHAAIELLEAMAVCPGKYLIVLAGEISAVSSAVQAATAQHPERLISSHVLGNPHDDVYLAMHGASRTTELYSLGVIETFDAATALAAADIAAKSAHVNLIEIRLAKGMCGKSFVTLTGSVGAVTAAVERAATFAGDAGMLLDTAVIANPDRSLAEFLF